MLIFFLEVGTYRDVRDFRFLKASAAIDRISLLLKSLKWEISLG